MRKKRQIKNLRNKKAQIFGINIPLVMLPILILLGIFTIFFTIEGATSGAKLANLEDKQRKLVRENQILEQEFFKASSLKDLGEKAQKLGFEKPTLVLYITKEEAVAKLP